jgi:hypothetical protein
MSIVILTLQLPRGGRGIPIATTADMEVLRCFKRVVIQEWRMKSETGDDVEAMIARLELERVIKAFDVFIPDQTGCDDDRV